MDNVRYVVYVRPGTFDSSRNPEVAQIEESTKGLLTVAEPYILIGPGRWGSSDPALGVPVRWPQIAGARLIVESALPRLSCGSRRKALISSRTSPRSEWAISQ